MVASADRGESIASTWGVNPTPPPSPLLVNEGDLCFQSFLLTLVVGDNDSFLDVIFFLLVAAYNPGGWSDTGGHYKKPIKTVRCMVMMVSFHRSRRQLG